MAKTMSREEMVREVMKMRRMTRDSAEKYIEKALAGAYGEQNHYFQMNKVN